jgi:hypothetical protein
MGNESVCQILVSPLDSSAWIYALVRTYSLWFCVVVVLGVVLCATTACMLSRTVESWAPFTSRSTGLLLSPFSFFLLGTWNDQCEHFDEVNPRS